MHVFVGWSPCLSLSLQHKGFALETLEEAFTSEHWLVRIYRVKCCAHPWSRWLLMELTTHVVAGQKAQKPRGDCRRGRAAPSSDAALCQAPTARSTGKQEALATHRWCCAFLAY